MYPIMISIREQLISEIETYLDTHNMNPTVFGRSALKDPNFVFDLRGGRNPSSKTIDKVRLFISAQAEASQ